jgi:NADPH-dependent curcumin reductase CurA
MPSQPRELRLASRPDGAFEAANWEIAESDVPEPADGEFLVDVTHISVNPAMRGWMEDKPSYVPPAELGEVFPAGGVGRVRASRHPRFADGDLVFGAFGLREVALSSGRGLLIIDPDAAPPETWIGPLGDTGLPAYFGLLEVGAMEAGDTVVVSAAAGAVGGIAGQIARIKGGRAIGIAGGPEKCRHVVEELGFEAAIDYKSESVSERLRELTGDHGVDVYFDNVGGQILDDVLINLAFGARVVICGAISQYDTTGTWRGPANYWQLLVKRARMEGFLVLDFAKKFPAARAEMLNWIADGSLMPSGEVVDGSLEDFPAALRRIFDGANVGKLILRI